MRKQLMDSLPSLTALCAIIATSLMVAACSTGSMDFPVSEQALNGNNTSTLTANSQNKNVDQEEMEESQPQEIIPNSSTQDAREDDQPIIDEEESETSPELDCTGISPPSVSHWPYRSPRGDSQNLMIRDARLGAHFDFDRFVLEFELNPSGEIQGPPDSYSIQWVSQPPIQFGSGQAIQVEGVEYLEILLHAHAYSRDANEYQYEGPSEVQARGTINVIEAVFGGEVEGKMVWAIGANSRAGFRVLEIFDPPRLVIDICTSTNG